VIETPTPVNVSAIRGKWLRDHINDKAGCCGAAELIKLYSYRLVEYDWVIHLDADVLIFQVRFLCDIFRVCYSNGNSH
jgi:alpha-N-acetylglucosamine transferase